MNIKERMKELRKANGYTLLDIAKRLGVSEATVQRYESPSGIQNIPYSVIESLSTLYGVTPEYLMGWSDIPADVDYEFTNEEIRLILEYRKADDVAKEFIRRMLMYAEVGKSSFYSMAKMPNKLDMEGDIMGSKVRYIKEDKGKE